jgi:hypothetical protein
VIYLPADRCGCRLRMVDRASPTPDAVPAPRTKKSAEQ